MESIFDMSYVITFKHTLETAILFLFIYFFCLRYQFPACSSNIFLLLCFLQTTVQKQAHEDMLAMNQL